MKLSNNAKNLILFVRSFGVSAFIGLAYLLVIEVAQAIIQYDDGLSHSLVLLVFYFLGIFINYTMQRTLVFKASNAPWLSFLTYNISSAFLVAGLSGYLYTNETLTLIFQHYIEAASTAISLLIISPITFFVFKKIFKH